MENRAVIDVIHRIRKGDCGGFSQIYASFEGLIVHYGRKIGEDGCSELVLFLLELIHSLDTEKFTPDGSEVLQRYIAVSLRNKYILLSKRAQARLRISNELCEESAKYITDITEPDIGIALREALSTVSERQRTVLIYRYFYGFSDAEIAELLGITRQAVHQLELRGTAELKKYYGAD